MKIKTPAILSILIFSVNICFAQQSSENKADSINQIIESAYKINNLETVMSELGKLAKVYEYDDNWELYDETVQELLHVADKTNDLKWEAEAYNRLGISNCLRGNNQKALEYFSKGLDIYLEQDDSIGISNQYENLGNVYEYLADYDKAIIYQMKSVKIRENSNYPRLVNNYTSLAAVYENLRDTLNQFQYLNKAKATISKNENPDNFQMAILYNEIASYYSTLNNMDSALANYKMVVFYSEKDDWKRGMAVGYGNMAELYSEYGETDKAIALHRKVLELSIEIDNCMGITEEYMYLASLYKESGKIDSSLILINIAIRKTEDCGLDFEKLEAYEFISELYESINKPALALDYYKLFHSLNDSIYNLEKHNAITEIETQYETEKKEQQIKFLSSENKIKSQNIKLGLGLIILLIISIVLGVYVQYTRKKQTILEQDKLKQKLFRSQMNPHFIFNALGSIQNYMYKNETKEAARFLGNFASLSRSILKYSSEESIDLEQEIETLKNYIDLERMRMKDTFDYEIVLSNDLETEFIHVPPMMIQPFIENAIKHGFRDMHKGGKLKIEFEDKTEYIKVLVIDNGIGLNISNQSKNKDHESMATGIFNQRMKYIRKKYPKIPEMEMKDITDNKSTGTKVSIFLPIYEVD